MSSICRLCLESESEKYYCMDAADYLPKIKSLVPEMDFEIVEAPCICERCSQQLLDAYSFKTNCLLTDEELKTYAKTQERPVNLREFLRLRSEEDAVDLSEQEDNFDMDLTETNIPETTNKELDICGDTQNDQNFIDVPDFLQEKTVEDILRQTKTEHDTDTDVTEMKASPTASETITQPLIVKVQEASVTDREAEKTVNHQRSIVLNKCPICNKLFFRKHFLELHLRKHRNAVPIRQKSSSAGSLDNKCEICKKKFVSREGLEIHLRTFKHYKCTVCNILKPSKGTLQSHMLTHTGERPHKCKYCGKGFGQLSTLNTHIRCIHMTEKPYICEVCGWSFPVKGAYTNHIKRLHQPVEKKFVCNYCGKAFRLNSILQRHLKWHTGEKNYLCQVCSKAFVCKAGLKKHMFIHTGEKPYECPLCQKKFSQNHNMKIHLKSCSKNFC